MTYNHKIGWIIRSSRESHGYSQDYMAEMLQICQSAYANIELGKTTISLDRLIRIAKILEMDIHDIISKSLDDQNIMDPAKKYAAQHPDNEGYLQLIDTLKSEIEFLRTLIVKREL